MTEQKYLSPCEVARLVGLSTCTVRRAIKRGDLHAYRISPRVLRVHRDDVRAWIEVKK